MIRRLSMLALFMMTALSAHGQGVPLPDVQQQQFGATGLADSAGFVCTYAAGTTTPLATYSDVTLSTNAHNPIQLNAAGRPVAWQTSTEIEVFAQARSYKVVIHAAGTGSTCNGTSVGTAVSTRDNIAGANVYTVIFATKNLDNVRQCDQFAGANAGIKWKAAVDDLPSTGGTADCRGFEGAQTIALDPYGGSTKCVHTLLGAATFAVSATIIVPPCSGITGLGNTTKLNGTGLTSEIVRLNGDYAYAEHLWLHGPGAIAGTVDGRRGIWIGCGSTTHSSPLCYADYTRVEDVLIDATVGNGISGDYRYARIVNNVILNTGDAGIFVQPASIYNLLEGNTIRGTSYSGFDVNGSHNRFVGNHSSGNGGGSLDANSQSGYLVTYISTDPTQPNANDNEFVGNFADSNVGCGFVVYNGATTAGIVNAPYGNTFTGNTSTGHTNQYNQNAGITLNQPSGGFCIFGGNNTTFTDNVSRANTFNYVVSGISNNTSQGNVLANNQSFNAATNAALTGLGKPSGNGYYFPGSARLDAVGGSPATNVTLVNNHDRYAAAESYRWSLDGAVALVWGGWTITGNQSDTAGTYGFRVVDPNSFGANYFDGSNYATGAATANYSGLNALGLTANSTTPSVANAISVKTQNTNPTIITGFSGGTPGQSVIVQVNDVNTTFDFTGSTLKGNAGVDFIAYTGDFLTCTYDGTSWWCGVSTQAISGGYANGVMQAPTTQLTDKSTTVAPTIPSIRTRITMNGAALNAATTVSFTFTNSYITANSRLDCRHFNVGTIGAYKVDTFPGAGSATVSVRNVTAGNLSEAIQLDCRVDPTQ